MITYVVKIDTECWHIPVDDCLRQRGVRATARQGKRDRKRDIHDQRPKRNRVTLKMTTK